MIHKSRFKDIDIPRCNILSYLFPKDTVPSTRPLWVDARVPQRCLSPATLLRWVQRFAVGLDRLGVPMNEAVMVFTPNHIFVPVVYLATAGSRRYFTGANPTYTVDELSFQIKTVKPAVILIHPGVLETGYAATFLAPEDEAASWTWDDLGDDATKQIAAINFSSGTTGLPKGVCISHYNLVSNSSQTIHVKLSRRCLEESQRGERWLAFLPLYHAFSQLFTINIACRLQATVYIMREFSFPEFLHYIQQYRITTLQAVPPVMNMLAKRPETAKYDLSSLQNIMVGAAAMPVQLSNDLMKGLDVSISRGWGMTETTCVSILWPDDTRDTEGSSGYLLPNTEAKVVDGEGHEVEDTPGELWVRGPQIMLGYWNNDQATNETCTKDRWLKTGDIVAVKDDLWWVVDREKEIIKVNGLQVAPAELEALLLQHEDIADAAVVGLTVDAREYPRAYVVVRSGLSPGALTESDVQRYVAGRLAKHKHLSGGVQFTQAIPRLPSGKVMRKTMKQWAKQDARTYIKSSSRL
ncbi:AMP-binding enzyme domain-containing protein [Cladophialophora immunda]|nr:AMP-binding enzyme domain-containing protein [Cladophialophora immunda]